jgi:hypothetical protein
MIRPNIRAMSACASSQDDRSQMLRRTTTFRTSPLTTLFGVHPDAQDWAHGAIQGWLGHWSITSTAVYTALAPNRFKDFWRE